ncbi:MAG TPA: PQQ-dependent sugar dehydrogenase [Phycisphaerales bacterium]|mgnify:CR=1 FL=1|nr:PQQ-dependent sugar dehydrogenase [Phycisphaerales bacterium]
MTIRPIFRPPTLPVLTILAVALAAGIANGQVVDTRIPLNYNFHGMAHPGEAPSNNPGGSADLPQGYRSISDRGLIFDATNAHSIAAYSGQNIGATGLSYAFYDTLGPASNPSGLDIVHLGSRCAGGIGAINAYEAAVNTATTVGIAPAWNVCDQSGTPGVSEQVTTLWPGVVIDPYTEIGILYHGSNGGGVFNVVLGFSDATTLPAISLACPDWFNNPADPAIVANMPLSVQQKLRHTEGATAFVTFQGATNNDAPRISAWNTSNLGNNLNVMEAVISVPMVVSGVGVGTGSWGAHPEVVGKTLTSIAFVNAGPEVTFSGARGYAVFAATVRTGQPVNAACETATTVAAGDTAAGNVRAFGSTASSCGTGDTSAVWFAYTATGSNVVDARTCGGSTSFDTTLAVYTVCGGQPIACDDNGCAAGSRVQWNATSGTQYLLRVAGNSGATGAFTLRINDPANIDLPLPLAMNFNGICHGASEQTLPVNTGTVHENRCDLNGYRSIADKGLLCDGIATNSLNYAGTFGFDGMAYAVVAQPYQLDIIHLGDRNLVANSGVQFVTACPASGTTTGQGMTPSWLAGGGGVDQTGPVTTVVSSQAIVFGAATRLGVLYHVSNVGSSATLATFDATLGFTDGSSTTVTITATDWAGTNGQVMPAPGAASGLEVQRVLGTFKAVVTADQAVDTTVPVKVDEAVISTAALIARGFNPTGRTLASITFGNPRSGNAAGDAFSSGFAIFAATVRDPASFNPDYGPGGVGTFTPNPVIAGTGGTLRVAVSRGTGSPNAVASVVVNASDVGLSGALALNDSGTGGDALAGDNIWSAAIAVPFASPTGVRSLPFTVTDAQSRTAAGAIVFTVNPPNPGDERRPLTPTITEPGVVGQVVNAFDVHMVTANFASPVPAPGTPNHLCSDWEIWKTSTSTRVWRATCVTDGALKVHIHLADGVFEGPYAGRTFLEYNTGFSVRVRHRDDSGDPVSEYSYWASRAFATAAPTQIFPLEADDFLDRPAPAWVVDGPPTSPVALPAGATLELGSAQGDLLLRINGTAGGNQLVDRPGLGAHVGVRARIGAPPGGSLSIAPSTLTVVDHECHAHPIYFPAISLPAGGQAICWVTTSGSTYFGSASDVGPAFVNLARGTLTPWEARQDGYAVENFASGFQLPVNIVFAPGAATAGPNDPYMYVTELYGQVMVVKRDGSVGVYASGLLNYNPTALFPGSGESGVAGICVEPATGDLFVNMLYSTSPPSPNTLRPKIVRMHSNDGGLTMATQTTIITFPTEPQGQSHQISSMTIGPDGMLYVHMGDGFDQTKGQDLTSARGKILRLSLDGTSPPDNPFAGSANAVTRQVWVYGLRNPFGGGWRTSDGNHFTIENGPSYDRISVAVPGRNYLYTGSDASMANYDLLNVGTSPLTSPWYPAHGPVNIAFAQASEFGGGGFPPDKMDHAYVTESGPTFGQGAQVLGKRIVEFEFAPTTGALVSGPVPLVEYTGSGFATCVGIAAGPDGLYFSELYKDINTVTPVNPTVRGANILRVRYVGESHGCHACAPDFDGVDGLSVQDIFAFLNAWFAGEPRADFNGVDGLSVQDIFDFLNAWFAGCP